MWSFLFPDHVLQEDLPYVDFICESHHSEKVLLHESYSAPFILNPCRNSPKNQSPII